MNKLFYSFALFWTSVSFSQVPAYYSGVDFSLMGLELKAELSDLITSTHTSPTTYSEVWDVLKTSDLDPTNSAVVLLIYGYNDDDGSVINDRTRDKNANGGDVGEWNREHVFPKSLASPELGETGAGADPHNLRASDVQANNNRSNRKFASGAGNAGTVGTNWYPGDEWIGDAARIIMYMYVRYGDRCSPNATVVGSTNAIDDRMIDLLLDWNAADPVSTHEVNRNNAIHSEIGNRNPFIDNPHIANHIWGGPEAPDSWGELGIEKDDITTSFVLYPNPITTNVLFISTSSDKSISAFSVFDLQGCLIYSAEPTFNSTYQFDLSGVPDGIYLLKITIGDAIETRKITIQ